MTAKQKKDVGGFSQYGQYWEKIYGKREESCAKNATGAKE